METADPLTIIDTHCHLDQPQFDDDREAVIERAMLVGVTAFVDPATNLDGCRKVLRLADRYPNVYAAVGVHPNECGAFDTETVAVLRELASHPKVVAIGEIGLDYYWEDTPHEQQKVALRAQLALAAELGLPVILHSRESNADLLWELEQWVTAIRTDRPGGAILGVLHAFSGDLAQAEAAYRLGFLLSLGGPVTFKNARQLHDLVPHLKRERLMLETDAPYLAPHPHRGQRNEPGYLPLVIEALAKLMDTTPQMVATQTTETARQCFKIRN
jgi:TatD DNase family protein